MYTLYRGAIATDTTLRYQGAILKNKLGAPGAVGLAQADLVRYLLTQEKKSISGWEKWSELSRQMIVEARDTTLLSETKPRWEEALRLFTLTAEAGKQAIEAESSGHHAEALRIHAELFQPGKEQLLATLERVMESESKYSDRKSTRLNSSHIQKSRMPSSA